VRSPWMSFAVVFLFVAWSGGIFISDGNAIGPRRSGLLSAASGDFSGTFAVAGGRKLYLECRGVGAPTVVLESGLRTRGDNWGRADLLPHGGAAVLPEVAKFARVCTYDRPGTTMNVAEVSRSDAVAMPRTAMDVVEDLHALLRAAAVPMPYVLVGHSFGGLFVWLYAAKYPEEVRGLVLVDALTEQIRPFFNAADWKTFVALNSEPLPGFEKYGELEVIDFDASFAQMTKAANSGASKRIPTVILVRGLSVELPASAPPNFGEALEAAWRKSEDEMAAAIPHIKLVTAKKGGHYIQWDEPELVVQAIREVAERARQR
jgi:pimeloyl-ACP methyl ester carboxylesterase